MKHTKQATIITPDQLDALYKKLPDSWEKARGILKRHAIDPIKYQRNIRKEWEQRLKRQVKLGLSNNR